MKILTSNAELIQQESGLVGAYKQIERVGRACWASENYITEHSYQTFIEGLIDREHNAPLEHGTIYLVYIIGSPVYDPYYMVHTDNVQFFKKNPYSKVVEKHFDIATQAKDIEWMYEFVAQYGPSTVYFITTNLRVIVENFDIKTREKILDHFVMDPYPEHEKRITVHFTCQRAISAEFNRHRKDSIMERSSRYCNFSKDKFGNEITFCIPSWLSNIKEDSYTWKDYFGDWRYIDMSSPVEDKFIAELFSSERTYLELITKGWKPQQAREVLPLCTATEAVYTAFESDWNHFFDLRYFESTGKVHPNMKELTTLMYKEYESYTKEKRN